MKEKFANQGVYTSKGQLCIMLAYLLKMKEFQHGPERQVCIEYITNNKWLDIQQEDRLPYPSASEPRWHTALSWARECLAGCNYIDRSITNSWRPTIDGINAAVYISRDFQSGFHDVTRCYMWSESFKKLMNSEYTPSIKDVNRPPYLYEDFLPDDRKSVRGGKVDKALDAIEQRKAELVERGLYDSVKEMLDSFKKDV
ncbi:MAG: hypothetical protein H7A51_13925 [Akkermansiaceae bacterium]|nr:hypothetical protein [Akkermansiaceae bacterium]